MRGKVLVFIAFFSFRGITPAYAGKSPQVRTGNIRHRDHPRLCGEKVLNTDGIGEEIGSPPPMRGKANFCR